MSTEAPKILTRKEQHHRLCAACEDGDLEKLREFIRAGCCAWVYNGCSAVVGALKRGHLRCVRMALNAECDTTSLVQAAAMYQTENTDLLGLICSFRPLMVKGDPRIALKIGRLYGKYDDADVVDALMKCTDWRLRARSVAFGFARTNAIRCWERLISRGEKRLIPRSGLEAIAIQNDWWDGLTAVKRVEDMDVEFLKLLEAEEAKHCASELFSRLSRRMEHSVFLLAYAEDDARDEKSARARNNSE